MFIFELTQISAPMLVPVSRPAVYDEDKSTYINNVFNFNDQDYAFNCKRPNS